METSRKFQELNNSLSTTNSQSRRDSQIDAQIAVLNKDYASTGRSFVLKSTTRTTNADWFNNAEPDSAPQMEMKNVLRQGLEGTLNVYTVGYVKKMGPTRSSLLSFTNLHKCDSFTSAHGLLGFSTFPSEYTTSPKDDGVGKSPPPSPLTLTPLTSSHPLLKPPRRLSYLLQPRTHPNPRSRSLGRALPHLRRRLLRIRRLRLRYPSRGLFGFWMPRWPGHVQRGRRGSHSYVTPPGIFSQVQL